MAHVFVGKQVSTLAATRSNTNSGAEGAKRRVRLKPGRDTGLEKHKQGNRRQTFELGSELPGS